MIGALIQAIIRGLGQLLFGWLREKKADADEARADSNESYNQGDKLADLAEFEADEERRRAANETGDPLDWK